MALMEFFGCAFIAFGPALSLFIFTIACDPLRVIILILSGFFWLLSLLISSLLWFAVVSLKNELAFGVCFSVLFQESFRLLLYLLLHKADEGLHKMTEQEGGMAIQLVNNKHLMAYVCGFGFGLLSGIFSLVNVLADAVGPGTIGIDGHSQYFMITSAFLTLAIVLLHIFWSIIFFDGLTKKCYWQPIIVVMAHMLVSSMTLMNENSDPMYSASIPTAYIVLCICGMWAFVLAGGKVRNLLSCIPQRRSHDL